MPVTRLAVFDLDGTLVDSRRDLADSANDMLAGYGAAPLGEDRIASMVGCGAPTLVKRVMTAAGMDAPLDEALARFLAAYDGRLTNCTRPYDGIPDLLDELQARDIAMAVLTNKPLEQSITILEAFELAKYFQWVVGGDGPWPRKPAPDGMQLPHAAGRRGAGRDRAGRRLDHRSPDRAERRRAHLPRALRLRLCRSRDK